MGMANLDRLRSKGYLDKYAPTAKAHALIDDLQGGSKIRELFTEYWTTYPVATSDGRELRHSYTTALELYREALTSYGHAYLIDALKREIAFRNSTPSKLKYMKGITAYLSTREYLNLRPEIATAKAEYGKTIS